MVCSFENKGLKYNKVPKRGLKYFLPDDMDWKSEGIQVLESLEYQGMNPYFNTFSNASQNKAVRTDFQIITLEK